MAIAGRVAPIPKGAWNSTTAYSKLDVVSHNYKTFMAKQTSTGMEPLGDDSYWMVIAENAGPMEGATEDTDGAAGLVPKPLMGDNDKVLFGDGTFKEVKPSALLIDSSGFIGIDYSVLKGE